MKEFFTTTIGAWDDGSVRLTAPGIAVVVVIIALLVVVAAVIRHRNAEKKTILTTKQLVYSAVAIALAVVCSMIKFANLPMGGSVTLFSMLFIALIGYWYGPYVGLMTAVAYGLVQFVMEPIFYTVPQMILDYPLAFGALGLAGVVFFGAYAPEGTPAIVYSLTYNATYIVPEAIATLIVISLPPVAKALAQVKKNALSA